MTMGIKNGKYERVVLNENN